MKWYDSFKIWSYSFENDPQTKQTREKNKGAVGYTTPDMIQNIQAGDSVGPSAAGAVRIGNEVIDLSSAIDRPMRYKEYERLRAIPEIEQVLTVIADEACIAGNEEVATVYHGYKSIKWLAENIKDEFFVYCWDFEKKDYTLGIAYAPRLVKKAKTMKVALDDGTTFIATPDHLVLLDSGVWTMTGELKQGDELKPFYRIPANQSLTNAKTHQYPRIYTNDRGWIHERQFIDEWKLGKSIEKYEKINEVARMICQGVKVEDIAKVMGHTWLSLKTWLFKEGFSVDELKFLSKKQPKRRVLYVIEHEEIDVYDLSVKDHKNFCGRSVIFHNCQKNNDKNVLEIEVKNDEVRDELKFLFLHRKMLNLNRRIWAICKKLCIQGDWFGEIVIDPGNPKDGILKLNELPAESMFRLETSKGTLLEFQQANGKPDYAALAKPVLQCTEAELKQSNALRFSPHQIIHMKLGEDRKTFFPYGQSLLEPARGPAHQLRLMEDSMVVYRLARAPERRVFYIDTGNLVPYRAEALMSRMQDLFRKRKTVRPGEGANAVDERYTPPSVTDDYWVPIRANSSTRIDTLQGAQNLGEIDDAVYFRHKLYVALNFPANYFSNEDVGATRITLSSQIVKFARMLERIQESIEDGLWEIADRHLKLRGFPEELYEDLKIKMTQPSEYRELSRAEVVNNRINNATTLKGSLLFSDWDILVKILKYDEKEAEEMISRMKNQKLEDAKMQIFITNPRLIGIGVPGADEQQMGAEPGGPSPMLGPDGTPPPSPEGGPPPEEGDQAPPPQEGPPKKTSIPLEKPEPDEIKKYDLEILDYEQDQDYEEPDYSEE